MSIEDNADDIMLINLYLKRSGMNHELTVASEEKDFLAVICSRKFDVVLYEPTLHGFNSTKVINAVKEKMPEVPFILVSGAAEAQTIAIAEQGADNYVLKDNMQRLHSAILGAIESKKKAMKE